jgi:hypothetical protein
MLIPTNVLVTITVYFGFSPLSLTYMGGVLQNAKCNTQCQGYYIVSEGKGHRLHCAKRSGSLMPQKKYEI